MPLFSLEAIRSKRLLGWLSWHVRRRRRYRPAVLEALLADLAQTAPDHLAITGDLTQIALEPEFREAARWLARFGPPDRVHAIPGNHDAYTAVPRERGWQHWSDYLASDPGEAESDPSVRVRGPRSRRRHSPRLAASARRSSRDSTACSRGSATRVCVA